MSKPNATHTLQKWLAHFLLIRNNWERVKKRLFFLHFWPNSGFKDTVLNLALLSLHGGSLEITRTAPLNPWIWFLEVYLWQEKMSSAWWKLSWPTNNKYFIADNYKYIDGRYNYTENNLLWNYDFYYFKHDHKFIIIIIIVIIIIINIISLSWLVIL